MSVSEVQGVAQSVRDRREAFPSDVVDHVENLEVLSVGKLVMHSTGKQSSRLFSDPSHSSDQRALGGASTKSGPRVPIALRRAFRLRTVSVVEKTVPGTVL